MVESVLFSIYHRARPTAASAADRERAAAEPMTQQPEASEPPRPEPAIVARRAGGPASAEPAAPAATPSVQHHGASVLEALRVHVPVPPEPMPPDAEFVAEPIAPDPYEPELTPAAELTEEAPQADTLTSFEPTLADETAATEAFAQHGDEPEPPRTEFTHETPQAHAPDSFEPTPTDETATEALAQHRGEPEPTHTEFTHETPQTHAPDPFKPTPTGETAAAETLVQHHDEPALPPSDTHATEQEAAYALDEAAIAPPRPASGTLIDHQLLGLANPLVFTVRASVGESDPVDMTAGRAGIYRPVGFRPPHWSSPAPDAASDHRTGLAAGTRLLTSRGEILVEELTPGDVALGLRGPSLLPILWIGRSASDKPAIRIEAGAFGPDRPRRPLCVAADHPVFLDPVPAPARALVNGVTIYTVDADPTELFHIDVGAPEVLLADGLPVASAQRSQTHLPG